METPALLAIWAAARGLVLEIERLGNVDDDSPAGGGVLDWEYWHTITPRSSFLRAYGREVWFHAGGYPHSDQSNHNGTASQGRL